MQYVLLCFFSSQGDCKYKVELHQRGEFTVRKVDLCLSEDQVKYLRENMTESIFTLASPAQKPDVSLGEYITLFYYYIVNQAINLMVLLLL